MFKPGDVVEVWKELRPNNNVTTSTDRPEMCFFRDVRKKYSDWSPLKGSPPPDMVLEIKAWDEKNKKTFPAGKTFRVALAPQVSSHSILEEDSYYHLEDEGIIYFFNADMVHEVGTLQRLASSTRNEGAHVCINGDFMNSLPEDCRYINANRKGSNVHDQIFPGTTGIIIKTVGAVSEVLINGTIYYVPNFELKFMEDNSDVE